MRAIVYTEYGPPDVLQLTEIAKPTPKDHELLVKICATTVTIGDTIMRSFNVPGPWWRRLFARLYLGVRKPKRTILGMELAGDVEAVGSKVTRFKPGDAVFASTFAMNFGGYVEYKCVPENGVVAVKPARLSYQQAAAAPGGGQTALQCLQRGNLRNGQKVLIYGASGAVGTFAVQLARHHFGAHVTGVCSAANVAMVKALGAATVIDYTRDDFLDGGATYDIIFDAVGKLSPSQKKAARKRAGTYLNVHAHSNGSDKLKNLLLLKQIMEDGKVTPFIDRVYSMEQIVEAHHYVEQGHKKGNVGIRVRSRGET